MDNNLKFNDEDRFNFFKMNLAYAGSMNTNKKEFKKMVSAMVIEYIHRGDIPNEEQENIWDELIDLAIDYMKYLINYKIKESKDER